jgi:glycine dehydrogenase subunit 1
MTRGEFLTAYTPYQPEVSQGTLQVIYEFQTLVSSLYDMEVANAGMYDGATSLAEGVLMACRVTRRDRVAIADTVSPMYQQVIRTYCQAQGIGIEVTPHWEPEVGSDTACLVVQHPNFFGNVEDLAQHSAAAHDQEALLVVSADPLAVGMLQPPGHYDADIVTGEGQPLGIPVSFGGPYVGLFSAKQQYLRQMPSRLVGRTTDTQDRTGYVLTLQTGSSTYAGSGPPAISAPTRRCMPWPPPFTWPPWANRDCARWQSCATTRPTMPHPGSRSFPGTPCPSNRPPSSRNSWSSVPHLRPSSTGG